MKQTRETIKDLPKEVQEDILSTLRVYDFTYITKVDGDWHISPNVAITSKPREIEDYGIESGWIKEVKTKKEAKEFIKELKRFDKENGIEDKYYIEEYDEYIRVGL